MAQMASLSQRSVRLWPVRDLIVPPVTARVKGRTIQAVLKGTNGRDVCADVPDPALIEA